MAKKNHTQGRGTCHWSRFLSLFLSILVFVISRLQHLLQSQSQSLLDVLLSVSILFQLRSLYLPVVMAPACIYQQFSCSMKLPCLYLSKLLLHTPHWYQRRHYFPLKVKSTYDCTRGTLRPSHVSVYVAVSTLTDIYIAAATLTCTCWETFIGDLLTAVPGKTSSVSVCTHVCIWSVLWFIDSNRPVTTLLIRSCIFILFFYISSRY